MPVMCSLEHAQELVDAADHGRRRGEELEIVGAERGLAVGQLERCVCVRPGTVGEGLAAPSQRLRRLGHGAIVARLSCG
jgi:hypothetical protein